MTARLGSSSSQDGRRPKVLGGEPGLRSTAADLAASGARSPPSSPRPALVDGLEQLLRRRALGPVVLREVAQLSLPLGRPEPARDPLHVGREPGRAGCFGEDEHARRGDVSVGETWVPHPCERSDRTTREGNPDL